MSWISSSSNSGFTIYNLPFGVFSISHLKSNELSSYHGIGIKRCATIIGDTVIDLSILEEAGIFSNIDGLHSNVFNQPTLNEFLNHPKPVWLSVRRRLLELLKQNPTDIRIENDINLQNASFFQISDVMMHLPIKIGDYTDFYASREHATNVGTFFRGAANALQPNWLHLPVGYHGRSSTIYCSGTPIRRPSGQLQKDPKDPDSGSIHGPTKQLDFELEVAAVVGGPSEAPSDNKPLTISQAKDRIFGYVLMNDWSARDIQKWEYVPLGPFTSKNFATTISPWIVTVAALEGINYGLLDVEYNFSASTSAIEQTEPVPLPYLHDPQYSSYDVKLSVSIKTSNSAADNCTVISQSNFRNMYWNATQQLTHHSVSGCIMNAGDLLGSGTISGTSPDSYGSLLELSQNGSKEVSVGNNETRKFLIDGDTISMKGFCQLGNIYLGFGDCNGTIFPAFPTDGTSKNDYVICHQDRYIDFVLYGFWRSSSTWRVRIALAAKSITYETIPIDLESNENQKSDYLAKNRFGQVPLLEWTDTKSGKRMSLSQSVAILHFLDEAFPERHSLIPRDPTVKAVALQIVEVINSGIQPFQNINFLKTSEKISTEQADANAFGKGKIEAGMAAIEKMVCQIGDEYSKKAGPYCLGTFSPTIVDTFVVPQLYNARRFNVSVDIICPTLVKIDDICCRHPWFMQSHPSVQLDAVDDDVKH